MLTQYRKEKRDNRLHFEFGTNTYLMKCVLTNWV